MWGGGGEAEGGFEEAGDEDAHLVGAFTGRYDVGGEVASHPRDERVHDPVAGKGVLGGEGDEGVQDRSRAAGLIPGRGNRFDRSVVFGEGWVLGGPGPPEASCGGAEAVVSQS